MSTDTDDTLEMLWKNIFNRSNNAKASKPSSNTGNGSGPGKTKKGRVRVKKERIFRYVAYGMTGLIDDDLRELFQKQRTLTIREEFLQLLKRKAPQARLMHGARRIGPKRKLLNDLFQDDQLETLIDELANSEMIVKGDPKRSQFLNSAVSFHGPMYQVSTPILLHRCFSFSDRSADLRCR